MPAAPAISGVIRIIPISLSAAIMRKGITQNRSTANSEKFISNGGTIGVSHLVSREG